MIGVEHYLVVAAVLFVAGLVTMIVKRNAIGILIGIELVLNSANINLVAFNRYGYLPNLDGQVLALFVIVLAAAEAAIALAIILNFYHNFSSIDVERGGTLKG